LTVWWCSLGLLTAVASAAALYAASPHCRWRAPRGWSRAAAIAGALLGVASLASWIRTFGAAAGVSIMLAAWMLAMIAWPWLTLFARGKISDSTRSP
jgi:hypothetical protein